MPTLAEQAAAQVPFIQRAALEAQVRRDGAEVVVRRLCEAARDGTREQKEMARAEVLYVEHSIDLGGGSGFRMIHPRGEGEAWSAAAAPTPGWRKGHWGGPAVRQVDAKAVAPSGGLTVPSLTAGIIGLGDRPLSVLGAIPGETLTATDSFAFLAEMKREHKAAEVAAAGLKPTSVYEVAKVEDKVRVIAHLTQPVDRSLLADSVALSGYLDGSLREGLLLRADSQIVNGDGEGVNLRGILHTEGITVVEYLEAGLLATTRRAVRTLAEDNPAAGPGTWLLSPADWEALELLTAEGSGVPVMGSQIPVDRAAQRLWGRPVVVSTVLPERTALLCDFAGSCRVYERESVSITWSEGAMGSVEGRSGFESNEVVWRGESRLGFAVLRPAACLKVETG